MQAALIELGVADPQVVLEKPRDAAHGDLATSAALVSAKVLGKAPRVIAEALTAKLDVDAALISRVEIAGPGFINFTLAPEYLHTIARDALSNPEQFGVTDDLAGQRVLIEFVSANPSGPLNVVSARAAAVGDTLCRMFRARQAGCDAEFYVNDGGNQVRLLGESVRARYESKFGNPLEIPEGGYHGEYVTELAEEIAATQGEQFRALPAEEASLQLGRRAVEHFVESHQATMAKFRVRFDRWFHENALREARLEWAALGQLKTRGAVFERDGATYVRTSEYGDGQDWVVVTSDGRPTYFLPDLAYHLDKYDRGYDVIIDILGPDHHSYLTKMKAGMAALGRDPRRLEVHLLQYVTLLRDGEPVKMSKRAGRLIEMSELLDEVGVDSARYFFLLRRTTTPLDFDIELAKKQSDENPVYYVQYAHARIESIFRKGNVDAPGADVELSILTLPEELDLLRRLRELPQAVRDCTNARDPHAMTVWLREVATQFHKFYHNCRVLTTPAELQTARLALCRATQIALARGLSLCGVSAPKEM